MRAFSAAMLPGARAMLDLWTSVQVYEDVLDDPDAVRRAILAEPVRSVPLGDQVFHGIRLLPAEATIPILEALRMVAPTAGVQLIFARQSPAGQLEPNDVHSDSAMGQMTAILYLNPSQAAGDGTVFWQRKATGAVRGPWDADCEADSHDRDAWVRWRTVEARYNRLVLFEADLYHSRALVSNYGTGDEDARLIVVAFLAETQP